MAMNLSTPHIRQSLTSSFRQFGYVTVDPSPSSPRFVLPSSNILCCPLSHLPAQDPPSSAASSPSAPHRDSPAVGQVERYAGLNVCPETQVPQDAQADVQDGDNRHPHIEDDWELLRFLHPVFQWQHLGEEEEDDDRAADCSHSSTPLSSRKQEGQPHGQAQEFS